MTTPEHLGKYEIHAELGRGAFATVYQALDTTLDREVALKILHPALLTDPTFIGRFKREARAMASLDHPHIATVYEVGEAEGRIYIALYVAKGPDLSEALARRGRFSWKQTLALLQPVCKALDYAHSQGVMHRDLKPSNLLLDSERGSLLTDFGFAQLMGNNSKSLSRSGGILGTPGYIAPEVWELENATPAVDIYALGCILYEMLTGKVLFTGKTPLQVMRAHYQGLQSLDTWSEGLPAEVDAILAKALAHDPQARYPSSHAFWRALYDLEVEGETTARTTMMREAIVAEWREEFKATLMREKRSSSKNARTPEKPGCSSAARQRDSKNATRICTYCGESNRSIAQYCKNCGRSLYS
jgi:eukaryotic-like serine/threonine-protein kinase